MLTNKDLKAIGNLGDKKLGFKISEKRKKNDAQVKDIFKKELDPIKNNVRKIKKDIRTVINYYV